MNVMKHVIRNNKLKMHNLSLLKLKLNSFCNKNKLSINQKKFSSKNQNIKEENKETNENKENTENSEETENKESSQENESKFICK